MNESSTNAEIETFCVIPSKLLGDLILSSSKKHLYVQTIDRKFKIRIPKTVESFKAFYNLSHYLWVSCLYFSSLTFLLNPLISINLSLFVARIGVTTDGKVYEICLSTKSIRLFVEWDHFIEDIVILQVSDNDVQLLIQTKSDEGCKLKIVDYPSKFIDYWSPTNRYNHARLLSAMQCHYELPIPLVTHLVSQSQASVNLYYLEEILGNDAIPQEIVMNLISESQPSERLKKLIRIGRLDEAEVRLLNRIERIGAITFHCLSAVRQAVQFE